jgi:hypothetical protein
MDEQRIAHRMAATRDSDAAISPVGPGRTNQDVEDCDARFMNLILQEPSSTILEAGASHLSPSAWVQESLCALFLWGRIQSANSTILLG